MLEAPLHAALVVVMTFVVNWLFGLIGLDLGGEVATGLATTIVGYILSLFGLSLFRKARGIVQDTYHPPFT